MTLQLIYNNSIVAVRNSYISIYSFQRAKECLMSDLSASKEKPYAMMIQTYTFVSFEAFREVDTKTELGYKIFIGDNASQR